MDAVTAGLSLVISQLCAALIMAGTFYAAPDKHCTKYWAQSGLLSAIGLLVVILNAGALNYPSLLIGNNLLIAGLLLQWWGIRCYYGRQPARWGWGILLVYSVLLIYLVAHHSSVAERTVLSASTTSVIFGLSLYELWKHRPARFSFASAMTMCGVALLMLSSTWRAIGNFMKEPEFVFTAASKIGIAVTYFGSMIGTLLFSSGLLLLYFERIVQFKHHLATHDELTGLLNRRAIIAAGERELAFTERLHLPMAVAYIDVDYFKQINDELGHERGDSVLAELAGVLHRSCRETDIVGRYGGEEFCVICPGIDCDGARIFGERLLRTVRNHEFDAGVDVTISIGIAVLPAGGSHRSWRHLMHEADRALYRAKEIGRDRFCIWSDAPVVDRPGPEQGRQASRSAVG